VDLQLLVGLGNPGPKYVETRHNVGFMVLERLAREGSASFRSQPRLQGLLAEVGSGEGRLRLLMPQTFMNESGRSIRAALDWFRLDASQLLVLVDDMDLPLGRLRLRTSGSAGGRLRIGIGAPADNPVERRERTISHVLGRFAAGERPVLEAVLSEVVAGIDLLRRQGAERAGCRLNSFRAPLAAASAPEL
jgi:PTH1 family peptidyl-tRNA hydrolase